MLVIICFSPSALGNANLVYTIIRKRHVFHALASLPTDCGTINRSLSRRGRKQLGRQPSIDLSKDAPSMEGGPLLQYNFC